jgi:hypothetical protein
MSKQYYYNPFGALEIHDGGLRDTWQKYYLKDNCTCLSTDYNCKTRSGRWHFNGKRKKPLANIEDDSTLLINAHGDWTANVLEVQTKSKYFSTDRGWVTITADDLAYQLMFDGLPKTHKRIRLVSCYGGGLNPEDQISDRSQAAAPFAKVLATILGVWRYSSIVVGGYCGAVWVPPGGGHNEVFLHKTQGSQETEPARNHRDDADVSKRMILWFDSSGKQVEKS